MENLWVTGMNFFNAGLYWEAHSPWETCWRTQTGPSRDYAQALIQVCGVFVHLKKNNRSPALKLCLSALKRLCQFKGQYEGPYDGPAMAPVEIPGLSEFLLKLKELLEQGLGEKEFLEQLNLLPKPVAQLRREKSC